MSLRTQAHDLATRGGEMLHQVLGDDTAITWHRRGFDSPITLPGATFGAITTRRSGDAGEFMLDHDASLAVKKSLLDTMGGPKQGDEIRRGTREKFRVEEILHTPNAPNYLLGLDRFV